MRSNIEIKARCRDIEGFLSRLRALDNVRHEGCQHQVDTYFTVQKGRMKLRQSNAGSWLIPYLRENVNDPKPSHYELLHTKDPMSAEKLLSEILGVLCKVEKEREIYHFENVRIHVDKVLGLGQFIEFEAVVTERISEEENREKMDHLLRHFEIDKKDLIAESYVDMILK